MKKDAPDILPSDTTPPVDPDTLVQDPGQHKTIAERIVEAATQMLGKDGSPLNLAPQELACAESVSNILHSVIPDVPANIVGTPELNAFLSKSHLFKRVLDPLPGTIVVSPTVGTSRGHCGIYLDHDKIASNSSFSTPRGLWMQNYTRAKWIAYFHDHQGLKGYLYHPVD